MNVELFAPELTLTACAIIVILLDFVINRKGLLAAVSIAGIVISAGFTIALWGSSSQAIFNNMLVVDNFALFFKLLFLGTAAKIGRAHV